MCSTNGAHASSVGDIEPHYYNINAKLLIQFYRLRVLLVCTLYITNPLNRYAVPLSDPLTLSQQVGLAIVHALI